jgi:putative PIN family toxin of toxin-antitoxin system
MRVVLDTNILVRAAKASDNPARELLRILRANPHVLIVSPYLLDEVQRVLRYPRVQKQHGLSEEDMQAFHSALRGIAAVVELEGPPAEKPSPDPDDNPILQTAVYGQASHLCSRDRHFRAPEVQVYCRKHGIQVVTDLELLQLLRRLES